MSNYKTFDVEGDDRLICDSKMFSRTGEYHGEEELINNMSSKGRYYYLYEDKVIRLVEHIANYKPEFIKYIVLTREYGSSRHSSNYDVEHLSSFDEEMELLKIHVPEEYHECSNCGAPAGLKERYDDPFCVDCDN